MDEIIAVSFYSLNEWGCPYCGFRSCTSSVSYAGSSFLRCGECGKNFVGLADGVIEAKCVGSGPKLQPHPRKGIPKHGNQDKRPEGGGEHFFVRGIGSDITPGCFRCGGLNGMYSNIAAFVQCKEAGERVVEMFKTGARLDYRESEPDRVQVKIGACESHKNNLEILSKRCQVDSVIKQEFIY
jgi:hypothetical protein